jgi:hypothetical protein
MGDEDLDHHVFERARAVLVVDEPHIGQAWGRTMMKGGRSPAGICLSTLSASQAPDR